MDEPWIPIRRIQALHVLTHASPTLTIAVSITRASASPEAVSLTETSRPIPEAHRLHQPVSYISNAPSPWNLCQAPSTASQMALSTPRQPTVPGYNAYRHDPNLILHPVYRGHERPATSLSRTPVQSYHSPGFLPASPTPFDQYMGLSREKHLEAGSPPFEPMIKQDDSEDLPCLKETLTALPSPSYKQARPSAPVRRELGFSPQPTLPDLSLRGASSGPMEISSLISSNL
jgi:hypothetical protein